MGLLTLLLPALTPAIVDGAKSILNRFFGSPAPTIAEQIELSKAQTESNVALASLDNPYGTISLWVSNLRAAIRPIGALVILGSSLGILSYLMYQISHNQTPSEALGILAANLLDLVRAVLSYLFGYSAWSNSRDLLVGYFTKKK